MFRSSVVVRGGRYRHFDNLAVDREGKNVSGMQHPYRVWAMKQSILWRNVSEAQWEHMRKVYRRQWFEAFRVNADEYIYKYNITKAAQYASWEKEMEDQDAERRKAMQQAQGRAKLRSKHLDILREYHERHFFQWYERASHRLQYLEKTRWITEANIDEHIEKELAKYQVNSSADSGDSKDGGSGRRNYPLNFAGQMPLLEDADLNVTQAPEHLQMEYNAHFPEANVGVYTPTSQAASASSSSGNSLYDRNQASPISSEIVVDGDDRTGATRGSGSGASQEQMYDDMARGLEEEKEAEEIRTENEGDADEDAQSKLLANKNSKFKIVTTKSRQRTRLRGAAVDTGLKSTSLSSGQRTKVIDPKKGPQKATLAELAQDMVARGQVASADDVDSVDTDTVQANLAGGAAGGIGASKHGEKSRGSILSDLQGGAEPRKGKKKKKANSGKKEQE